MQMLDWCKDTFINENAQKHLEERITLLLKGPLKDKGEYAQEKAIKSFSEGLRLLESILLRDRKIHPHHMEDKLALLYNTSSIHREQYIKLYEEVERILIVEINRQYRHFCTFL